MKKICIFDNHFEAGLYLRFHFLGYLVKEGFEVIYCAAQPKQPSDLAKITSLGVKYYPCAFTGGKFSMLSDYVHRKKVKHILSSEQPDIILLFTIKPVVYVSIIAAKLGFKNIYSFITGMGYLFFHNDLKTRFLRKLFIMFLYRRALKVNKKLFFHNRSNQSLFSELGLISEGQSVVVNGSGVDLQRFKQAPLPAKLSFLFVGRLTKEKGVEEYLEAACQVKAVYPEVAFCLAGPAVEGGRSACAKQLDHAVKCGAVEYLGFLRDVVPAIKHASVCVLPSHHEGRSKFLLESMSMGRAIITSDAPGCSETILPGVNGLVVPVKNAQKLVDAFIWFIQNQEKIPEMGRESRSLAEKWYDVNMVNTSIVSVLPCHK